MRVLPSHHCELGSNLGPGITCGLSSLLVLVLMLQGVFCGSSSFPLSAKYQHSKFQFNLAKVDGKSHPMDCPMLKSNYFFVCVYCHPCMLCHFWDQSLRIYCLGGGGIGGFLLYHTEINLVGPPSPPKKRLCGVLTTPFIGSQCSVAPPPPYLVSYDCFSPLLP